jgi:hypothetical protein
MASILRYICALAKEWKFLMSGTFGIIGWGLSAWWQSLAAQWLFAIVAVIAFRAATYQAWRSRDKELEEANRRLEDKQRRREIRNRLGRFLDRGNDLMRACIRNQQQLAPASDVDEWAREARQYLQENLGDYAPALFENWQGLPQPENCAIAEERHRGLWMLVRFRAIRLEQFINEMRDT